MSKLKYLLLTLSSLSTLLPYSNTCGSPLITNLTTDHLNHNSTLFRDFEVGSISTFYVRDLSNALNVFEEIQFELLATNGINNFYGEVSEISNGHIDLTTIEQLFQAFTSDTPDADSLNLKNQA